MSERDIADEARYWRILATRYEWLKTAALDLAFMGFPIAVVLALVFQSWVVFIAVFLFLPVVGVEIARWSDQNECAACEFMELSERRLWVELVKPEPLTVARRDRTESEGVD